ncbi:hypothetical protein M422DRAFT_254623 [Sphaerobolus stellatus SS14]|uniref:Uncharacterized protein n=1 Tax=Sphaerobolus stellatus (strain SS14) TaxID=990650 RepID=A0A0C9UGL4_SPHS4|nr:hypothetical protein M422DRAFT_254623 [Sphaerobolus stellatus SS14]
MSNSSWMKHVCTEPPTSPIKQQRAILNEQDDGFKEAITTVVEEHIIKDTTCKKNHTDAHKGQAHLKKDEGLVLVEYCKVQGLLAQPLSSLGLHQHVYELSRRSAREEWGEVIALGIPTHNIFNFNKKGIQLGGGCKNIRTKYIFSATDINCYVKKSDNLVWVLLECVLGVGKNCLPTFVLPICCCNIL